MNKNNQNSNWNSNWEKILGFRNVQEKLDFFFCLYPKVSSYSRQNLWNVPRKKNLVCSRRFFHVQHQRLLILGLKLFMVRTAVGTLIRLFFNHFHVSPLKAVLLSPFFLLRQISAGTLSASCPNIGDSYGTVGHQGWPLVLAPFRDAARFSNPSGLAVMC